MNKYEAIYSYLQYLKRWGYTNISVKRDGNVIVNVSTKKRDKEKGLLIPEDIGKVIRDIFEKSYNSLIFFPDFFKLFDIHQYLVYRFSIDDFMIIVKEWAKKHERG